MRAYTGFTALPHLLSSKAGGKFRGHPALLAPRTHRAGFAFARLKLYRARILPQPPVYGLIRAALKLFHVSQT